MYDPVLFLRLCVIPNYQCDSYIESTPEQMELLNSFRAELDAALDQFLPRTGYDQDQEVRDSGRKVLEDVRSALLHIQPPSLRCRFNDVVWEQLRAFESRWSEWRFWNGRSFCLRRQTPGWLERYWRWRYRSPDLETEFWNPPGT